MRRLETVRRPAIRIERSKWIGGDLADVSAEPDRTGAERDILVIVDGLRSPAVGETNAMRRIGVGVSGVAGALTIRWIVAPRISRLAGAPDVLCDALVLPLRGR